jgi:general stress protein YciG
MRAGRGCIYEQDQTIAKEANRKGVLMVVLPGNRQNDCFMDAAEEAANAGGKGRSLAQFGHCANDRVIRAAHG